MTWKLRLAGWRWFSQWLRGPPLYCTVARLVLLTTEPSTALWTLCILVLNSLYNCRLITTLHTLGPISLDLCCAISLRNHDPFSCYTFANTNWQRRTWFALNFIPYSLVFNICPLLCFHLAILINWIRWALTLNYVFTLVAHLPLFDKCLSVVSALSALPLCL